MKKGNADSVLVWSSDAGRICPGCGKAAATCNCRKSGPRPAGDGIVRVRRESKGRGGKTVTVVKNFVGIGLPEKEQLAKVMQKACGTGGTVKNGQIEIQGDKRAEVARILTEANFHPVFAGG